MAVSRRVLVTGGPGTGKTTFAHKVAHENTLSTDSLLSDTTWESQRSRVVEWEQALPILDASDGREFLIEGVTVARCLRHGELLTGAPVVFFFATVLRDIKPRAELLGRSVNRWIQDAIEHGGVEVVRVTAPTLSIE